MFNNFNGASFLAALGGVFTANATMPFFGVPFPVVVMAAAGTLAGVLLGDPIEPRRKLYGHAFAYTLIGAALTAVIPLYLGWAWAKADPAKLAPLALLISASCRWIVPAFIENAGAWLSNINPFKRK